MKIYILTGTNTQLALDAAHVLETDVAIAEKPGGITVAYPISDLGLRNLDSLGLESHRQPEYGTSFYAMPFELEDAKKYLGKKFKVEYV